MTAWKPIATAPKDGSIIELMHWLEQMPCVYVAWWWSEEHMWILNDDDSHLIEEDTDLADWYWRELERPDNVIRVDVLL